jgi:glycosyltransferase involved in cell wall biosynthesis
MSKALYICYFGIREPLVQTQVLPYLRELVKGGHKISLLTFEGNVPELENYGVKKLEKELTGQAIDWYWGRYHKRLSVIATTWDILWGTWFVWRFIKRERPDILHGRVHVPTLMGAMGRRLSRHKPKLLFDIRGFFPEEYTDAGIWPENGLIYRAAKRVERWLLREADGFVVLTNKARDILFPGADSTGTDIVGRPVEVIPCCVDLGRFQSANKESRKEIRQNLGIENRFVAAYVGAFGGWYLTKETAEFFEELKRKRPDAFAMILTQSRPEMIEPLLRERGYGKGDYIVIKIPPDDIPKYLSGADAAVSFIKRCYSKQASSPTKNAEYLASGLPIIANAGVGDVDELIGRYGVGSLVDEFSAPAFAASIEAVTALNGVGDHCREIARREFDLVEVGGNGYRRIYEKIIKGRRVNSS